MSIKIQIVQIIFCVLSANLSFGLPTGNAKDLDTCSSDYDCPPKLQYCYDVSRQCVDYAKCEKYYNRQNPSQGYARDASQCGPCIKGYVAQTLGTGEQELVCKNVSSVQGNIIEFDPPHQNKNSGGLITIISIITFLLLSLTVTLFVFFHLRKPVTPVDRDDGKTRVNDFFEATAPPPENSPFIGCGDQINLRNIDNNRNDIDKTTLVAASPFKPPSWVTINPGYGQDYQNDNLDPPDHNEITAEDDTNPSSWVPEQSTIQVPSRPFSIFANGQPENPPNFEIVPRNRPSRIEQGHNDNRERQNSEPSGNDGGNNVRNSNVMITQKITMNVNVLNGVNDC